eukprot:m.258878 g.258878  ORF g.258878 m.258878 type:complete len:84 (-) comp37222_c0_seq1:170-421(-)
MKLALVLFNRSVPGKQWIGKHRKIFKLSENRRQNYREDFARIMKGYAMISQPYLTHDESVGMVQRFTAANNDTATENDTAANK